MKNDLVHRTHLSISRQWLPVLRIPLIDCVSRIQLSLSRLEATMIFTYLQVELWNNSLAVGYEFSGRQLTCVARIPDSGFPAMSTGINVTLLGCKRLRLRVCCTSMTLRLATVID